MRAALLALCLAACQAEPNEGHRMPKLAPAPDVEIPAAVRIAVEIDGRAGETIDKAKLDRLPPDFADDQRKAWRMTTLVGALGPGAVLKVTGAGGVTTELPHGGEGPIPVLLVSRRGEVVAVLLDPKQPFPAYHGQGGRLGRSNDPLPRVTEVQRIAVVNAAEPPGLAVKIGTEDKRWTQADLARVVKLSVKAEGEGTREAWSLRSLARELVGPKARVNAVSGEGSRRIVIDEQSWNDQAREPILRLNKQSRFRFQWLDASGDVLEEDELRNVKTIELAP